jgi:hypothetical protein
MGWCNQCTEGGVGEARWEDGRRREGKWEGCKPWRGTRCVVYHEHGETERCGDVFMGRGGERRED